MTADVKSTSTAPDISEDLRKINVNNGDADIPSKGIYTSESRGSDECGDGTFKVPYKTIMQALRHHNDCKNAGSDFTPVLYQDSKPESEAAKSGKSYDLVAKAQLKKISKLFEQEVRKLADKAKRDAEANEAQLKRAEEAKSVVISEDKSLPQAVESKIRDLTPLRDSRVKVYGWVHRLRRQGKSLMFITLRDGTGYLQAVLCGELCQTYDAIMLSTESTICIYGKLQSVPEDKEAPGGHEIQVDYWYLIGSAPAGGADAILNEQSNPDVQLDNRHIMIRGQNTSMVLRLRSFIVQCFREELYSEGCVEVTPPTMVETQVEGGSSLFDLNYFGRKAYLTQSSQMYLESVIPAVGDVFCIAQSYRAEQSRTRRHIAEYSHLEAEYPFITFEKFLCRVENLLVGVCQRIWNDEKRREEVLQLNSKFVVPKKPFKRMHYREAIEWLKSHNVRREDGTFYEIGDDIPEAPERAMTDAIGEPIMLHSFPHTLKAFYMERHKAENDDPYFTESVDVLLPNVGEVVGGSMRIKDYNSLMEAYKREGLDPEPYYWYTDQRRFGTCEHGGFGLGVERFLCWVLDRYHIRDVCLYPRFMGRCQP